MVAKIKKKAKYTKVIPIRFSEESWHRIIIKATKEKLEPSTWIRKNILDTLNGN